MSKQTLHSLFELKKSQDPIAVLTAYDATFAQLLDNAGIEVILVGDSLGMVIQGHASTVPVTMQDMVYHTQAVARGNKNALIVSDLPYMSYANVDTTLSNAAALMQAGANMVKLEGGEWLLSSVTQLSQRGIPVCAHLGLTPQSVDALGGYKVQGRNSAQAKQILKDALALENAGASMLVLECVPQELASKITQKLTIPTIGIGAGNQTDGQVLVLQDMLGLNPSFQPKFVKNFMLEPDIQSVEDAIKRYVQEVKSRQFPTTQHSFN
ncbi:3-methyl-2-oxobutanoate hydroxymethyltransferase [Aliikangiella sp. IMCC44632]